MLLHLEQSNAKDGGHDFMNDNENKDNNDDLSMNGIETILYSSLVTSNSYGSMSINIHIVKIYIH